MPMKSIPVSSGVTEMIINYWPDNSPKDRIGKEGWDETREEGREGEGGERERES